MYIKLRGFALKARPPANAGPCGWPESQRLDSGETECAKGVIHTREGVVSKREKCVKSGDTVEAQGTDRPSEGWKLNNGSARSGDVDMARLEKARGRSA